MTRFPLVVGEAVSLDFKHSALATQPGGGAARGMPSLRTKYHVLFYTDRPPFF